MEQRDKLKALDGLEVLSVQGQQCDFPEHYHETFCISLIHQGVEAIKMRDQVLLTEAGMISINNPFEIHSNPVVDGDSSHRFTTLYLSPDLVDTLIGEKGISFAHQQAIDSAQAHLFSEIVSEVRSKDSQEVEKRLISILKSFRKESRSVLEDLKFGQQKWDALKAYIDERIEHKISLEELGRFMHMDKFNFAKAFRARNGLSPMNYVLMQKVFAAKNQIDPSTKLSELAYQFDFTDSAHFSRQFKRFVGVSPSTYKKQLK